MVMPIERMLPLLQCPRTGSDMSFVNGKLVSTSGEEYPVIHGIPVLVRQIQDFHIIPPADAFISKNTATYSLPPYIKEGTVCLHLGSGDVPCSDERVISMDILPTASVDMVAEAEALPFKTGSLDYVESGAVFEHVFNPIQSAEEVRRVLKDGGEMFIDTAFLQGYHGFPSHYFNMTPQAVETFLCDDFILEESYVPHAAMVTHALVTQFDRFMEMLPIADQKRLKNLPLSEAIEIIRANRSRNEGITAQISEYGHRSLAASFAIRATKPANYELVRKNDGLSTRSERVAYYAARMGLIQRHHEIELYRRFAIEKHRNEIPELSDTPDLHAILNFCKVVQPTMPGAFAEGTQKLNEWNSNLTAIRDQAIRIYLAPPVITPPL